MTPGTYRLTRDMPALRPDKRKRNDWRAAPMTAGTLFAVEQLGNEPATVHLLGGYFSMSIATRSPGGAEFVAALERIEESPGQYLARQDHGPYFLREIIDALADAGKITVADIQAAEARLLREDQ